VRIAILPTPLAAARTLADVIAEAIRRQPALVLGLPTGKTPIALYSALVERHQASRLDFRRVTAFNIDEFVGLPAEHPGSFAAYMARHLYRHVNFSPRRSHLPAGDARNPQQEAARYEAAIDRAGGIDLMVLGIGRNGHIGFNEPASSLVSDTHVARLTPETRRSNADAFDGDWRKVPRTGITMGVGTLLRARHVILIATGASKARIVSRALEGPIATNVPASLLQAHPNLTVFLDRAAAGRLSR